MVDNLYFLHWLTSYMKVQNFRQWLLQDFCAMQHGWLILNIKSDIKKKAEENVHIDCPSRSPIYKNLSQIEQFMEVVSLISNEAVYHISKVWIIKHSQKKPRVMSVHLSKIKVDPINGTNYEQEYQLQNGIIFKGQRVVVPSSMYQTVLAELHHTHVDIVKMKQSGYVYWKNIDKDIENLVKTCADCSQIQKKKHTKVPVHDWDEPSENMKRIYMDCAARCEVHHFLIIVDFKSRWVEVRFFKNAPTTESTITFKIHILSSRFTKNPGLWQRNYLQKWNIYKILYRPGHRPKLYSTGTHSH